MSSVAAHGTMGLQSDLEDKKRDTGSLYKRDQHASVLELCIHASNGIREVRDHDAYIGQYDECYSSVQTA
jgi:hypothetical protein